MTEPAPSDFRTAPPTAEDERHGLVAVFAHPDDETFAMGATLARYAGEGIACHLLCATDGDGGRTSGVTDRAGLGAMRRRELHDAARVLGVRTVRSLGLPDGGLPAADADALVGEIVRVLRERRPRVVVTFGPEGAPNAHPDHRAVSRAATAAWHLAALPSAFPEQLDAGLAVHAPGRLCWVAWDAPRPGDPVAVHSVPPTVRLDARPWHDVKRAAFEAHRSQHELRDRFEAIAMRDDESFATVAGRGQPAARVDDLFAGLE